MLEEVLRGSRTCYGELQVKISLSLQKLPENPSVTELGSSGIKQVFLCS